MTTYNNVFNGNFVQPSTISFRNIVLNAPIQLTWPTTYLDDAANNVAASVMTVQANAGAPVTINLPLNPVQTFNGSNIIQINGPFNSQILSQTPITIAGSADVNAITAVQININSIAQGVGANSFQYPTAGNANANGSGGGAAVTATYNQYQSITLPNATQVSVGQPLTFVNNGLNPFYIYDFAGNFLLSLRISQTYDFILTDNTTIGGTWLTSLRGATTSTANAQAIQGLGLTTIGGTLNSSFPSKIVAGNYTAVLADRASLLVWTGGAGTINLPSSAIPTPSGYYLAVNNNGTGVVNVTTTDGSTIDSLATFSINPGGSSEFVFNSPNWNSLGFGQSTTFQVNTLALDVTAGGQFNETSQQASRLVQTFTGNMIANTTVTFPVAAGQWYIYNHTAGLNTLGFQLFGIGAPIIVPQGEKVILYSDGANLYQTPTVAVTANFGPGSVANPTIVFTNSNNTGFYSFAGGNFGFSAGGNLAANLGTLTNGQTGISVAAGNVVRLTGTNLGNYATLSAGALGANVNWTLPLADATVANQVLVSNAAGQLSYTAASYPNASTINQILYSSAANTVTGLATANNGVLVTSAGGIPSISSTIPQATQLNIVSVGTITTGVWNGTPVTVQFGGTGVATLTTAYGTLCAGTTATNPVQTVAPGAATQVLTSNGAAALPTYQAIPYPAVPFVTNIPKVVATFTNMANPNPTISYNVGVNTIVRNAAGDYTITYTNAFVTNFPVVMTNAFGLNVPMTTSLFASSSNSCRIFVTNLAAGIDPAGALFLSVMGV